MTDTQAIAYRRMVASLARELSAEEVKEVAYIRLTGVESISKYTSNPPIASGLDLLATLERLGVFSQKNTEGLVDIAKDVNRHDLAKKVENYRKYPSKAVKCTKKKQRGLLSEERQHLEDTFELMVTQFAVLEQHVSLLQRALDGEQEEALEVLRVTGMVVQGMGTKLSEAHERLARRSPDSSNSSDGDSRPSSDEDTAPHQEMARDRGSLTNEIVTLPGSYPLSSGTLTKSSPIDYLMPAGEGTADSDEDVTGDSGMGTGSGSAQYEDVEAWRQAMNNPLPGSKEHTYQAISLESREPDSHYQKLQKKPK